MFEDITARDPLITGCLILKQINTHFANIRYLPSGGIKCDQVHFDCPNPPSCPASKRRIVTADAPISMSLRETPPASTRYLSRAKSRQPQNTGSARRNQRSGQDAPRVGTLIRFRISWRRKRWHKQRTSDKSVALY